MSGRDNALDMMKGWLTILMVLSHLTYVVEFDGGARFNAYVNLTTFSGFMFCFGYVCRRAYIDNERADVTGRMLKGAARSLLAFYICGIGFYMRGTILEWGGVVFLQRIPMLTEFLLSFSLLYIVVLMFREQLQKLTLRSGIILTVVSLIFTAEFPFEIITGQIMGSLVGTTTYCSFPLLSYSGYFIAGSLLAKYQVTFNKWLLFVSGVATGIFCACCKVQGRAPGRFPPTVCWIVGGGLFIYIYYCIFKLISQKGKEIKAFTFIGRHTLVWLTISNLLIFFVRNYQTDGSLWRLLSVNHPVCIYIAYVIITCVICGLIIQLKERRKHFGYEPKQN